MVQLGLLPCVLRFRLVDSAAADGERLVAAPLVPGFDVLAELEVEGELAALVVLVGHFGEGCPDRSGCGPTTGRRDAAAERLCELALVRFAAHGPVALQSVVSGTLITTTSSSSGSIVIQEPA